MDEIKKIETFALIDELAKREQWELEFGILTLLINKKINYKSLSEKYVEALEEWNEDKDNQFSEACMCVLDSFCYKRKCNSSFSRDAVQRALYLLNKSSKFQMGTLNEKYNYNEEEAKKLSWYERNKNNNV